MIEDEDYAPPRPVRRRPSVRSESDLTREAIDWLNSRPGTYAWKLHTTGVGEGGHPDIDGCSNGRSIKIEMKRPGERPTSRQVARMTRWAEAGALTGWAQNLDHVRSLFARRDQMGWRADLAHPGDGAE